MIRYFEPNTIYDGPRNGTLQLSENGSFTYTPNADFFGTDSFTFTVTDRGDPDGGILLGCDCPIEGSGLTMDGPDISTVATVLMHIYDNVWQVQEYGDLPLDCPVGYAFFMHRTTPEGWTLDADAPADFVFPDALWARVVYDFALGHHYGVVHRDHLLRSLVPLYLGRTAAYVAATQRLDKWLTYARFAKTRTVAQALVVGGKVRVNRIKATDGDRPLRIGDILTIATPREVRVVRVIGFAERRVSPSQTPSLYEILGPDHATG